MGDSLLARKVMRLKLVQPLRLANYGRRWYLIAWDIDRSDWRSFRVDRIEHVAASDEHFDDRYGHLWNAYLAKAQEEPDEKSNPSETSA